MKLTKRIWSPTYGLNDTEKYDKFFVGDEFCTETCMLLLSPAYFSNMSGHMTKLSQKEKEKHLPV